MNSSTVPPQQRNVLSLWTIYIILSGGALFPQNNWCRAFWFTCQNKEFHVITYNKMFSSIWRAVKYSLSSLGAHLLSWCCWAELLASEGRAVHTPLWDRGNDYAQSVPRARCIPMDCGNMPICRGGQPEEEKWAVLPANVSAVRHSKPHLVV